MSCNILIMDNDEGLMKTNYWLGLDKGDSTLVLFHDFSAKIPVPFDIFDKYTDYCEEAGIKTADFTPDNIPKIMQMFGQKLGSPFQLHP